MAARRVTAEGLHLVVVQPLARMARLLAARLRRRATVPATRHMPMLVAQRPLARVAVLVVRAPLAVAAVLRSHPHADDGGDNGCGGTAAVGAVGAPGGTGGATNAVGVA